MAKLFSEPGRNTPEWAAADASVTPAETMRSESKDSPASGGPVVQNEGLKDVE
jgi:hypothetical protein